jgi:hypothetical protein
MHGLQTLKKINNPRVSSYYALPNFNLGDKVEVHINGKEVESTEVTSSTETHFEAGGIVFERATGFSIGLDNPAQVVDPIRGKVDRTMSAAEALAAA